MSPEPTAAHPSIVEDVTRPSATASLPLSIESRHPEPVDDGGASQPTVLKWIDRRPRAGKNDVVGIEFDGSRLVLAGIQRKGRNQTIHGFLTADFDRTPTRSEITALLREFDPAGGVHAQVAVAATRGVVRQFTLPLLPKRQRLPAAIWEGQKLIPFPLKSEEALFGFSFAPGPSKNLLVTLVAVPRADAAEVLGAVDDVNWTLDGVSISGANRLAGSGETLPGDGGDGVVASAVWTSRRGSFMVFRHGRLQFQYDLGSPPELSSLMAPGEALNSGIAASWVKEMGRAIGDALEFYSGAYPQYAPDRLELTGVTTALAPLITDWHEHFGLPVVVVDTLEKISGKLPEQVRDWIRANPASLTAAALAAAGRPAIDLSPSGLVVARRHRLLNGVARGLLILSAAAVLAWTGLLWMHLNLATQAASGAAQERDELLSSAPASQVEQVAGVLIGIQAVNRQITTRPQPWMPWVKSITSTIPPGVELSSIGLELPESVIPGTSLPVLRLEGKLRSVERPYSLTYADWINRLDQFAGEGSSRLVSDRMIDWHGKRFSAFVLEVRLPGAIQGASK